MLLHRLYYLGWGEGPTPQTSLIGATVLMVSKRIGHVITRVSTRHTLL